MGTHRDAVASRLVVILSLAVAACAAPSASQPTPPGPANAGVLDVAPQLARYTRFEIASQAVVPSGEQRAAGSLDFQAGASTFAVSADGRGPAGRLQVQPDACRDDPEHGCLRRFVISGRLNILDATLNCYIPVRNDTDIGYARQALSGICQDRYSRVFAISLFAQ